MAFKMPYEILICPQESGKNQLIYRREMKFKRAMTADSKKLRVDEILLAAEKIITEKRFELCNLNDIANDVGMSKTALYRYFRVKELIFLALYLKELSLLTKPLESALLSLNSDDITEAIIQRPVFCKLSSILTTVLEQPLKLEEAILFKQQVATILQPTITLMMTKLRLTPEQAISWLMHLFAAIVGCWHITNPSALMNQAYENEHLVAFKMDFKESLNKHIKMILNGIFC